jgi:NAD+ synthetase
MIVSLCQINTTPNDFPGNAATILRCAERAYHAHKKDGQPSLIIFPELTIPGYSVKDLVYTDSFIESNLRSLDYICRETKPYKNAYIIVGYVGKNTKGVGKPFTNMVAVIHNGYVVATYQKHLLPFYDVFDEGRYFEPGTELTVLDIQGEKFGITICEDCWNDKGQDDYSYIDNPIQSYRKLGITNIINVSSSPYALGKPGVRKVMLEKITRDGNLTLFYCNQYGGQDELVFDGKTAVFKNGSLQNLARTSLSPKEASFTPVILHYETNDKAGYPFVNFSNEIENDHLKMSLLGLYDYIVKSGFDKVVLGSSGGIDSAVVAALASMAIGPENVNCIMMPSIYSSEGSVNDAKALHKNLGCKEHLVPIEHEPFLNKVNSHLGLPKEGLAYNKVADENLQARMRGQIVMHFSNATGALPLTTGNKTELAVGYCTLYGDMNGGFNPIGDMYKMQVYDIARKINAVSGREIIPQAIIDKAPSAELRPGQTDEASLLPYPILDRIVEVYVEHKIIDFDNFVRIIATKATFDNTAVMKWCGLANAKTEYNRIKRLIYNAEFKRRQAAPTIKLSRVAFGTGRRIPIVKGTAWQET